MNIKAYLILLLIGGMTLLAPQSGAASYTLTIIATNTSSFTEGFSAMDEPSINNVGEVAFRATPAGWPRGAIVKATTNSLTVLASTQTDTNITEVDYSPKIADNGTVVFRTYKSGFQQVRQLVAISDSSTQVLSAGVSEVWTDSIDADTTAVARGAELAVAFLGTEGLTNAAYRWSGGNLAIAAPGSGPVVSVTGSYGVAFGLPAEVLFGGLEGVGFKSAIFGSTGLGSETIRFVDSSPGGPYTNGISSFFAANGNGALAIIGYTGNATVVDVIQGGVTNRLAAETNVFGGITRVAMNNSGTVAFQRFGAGPMGSYSGIYTGPDIVADKVVANGDPVEGVTISNVELLNRQGINDAGQIVFLASLSNGRKAVVLATPAPAVAPAVAEFASIQQAAVTNILLAITGQVGTAYVVQRTTNFFDWLPLTGTNLLLAGTNYVTDPGVIPTSLMRFYRLFKP